MSNSYQSEADAPVNGRERACSDKRALRVYMMDLWSFIPYYVARLCAALKNENVEVTLGSVRYHLDRNYFRNAGLTPDRRLFDTGGSIPSSLLRRAMKSIEYLVNLFFLGFRLSPARFDILHVQYLPFLERQMPFELWFLSWIKRRGISVIYTVHNVTRQDAPEEGLALFGRAYHIADALICHGEEARAELIEKFNIAAERIRVIPHGPLFEAGSRLTTPEARAKLGLPQEDPLVVSMGVISEYKGIPFLLDAWKELKQRRTPGRLLIAGTGDPGVLSAIRNKVAEDRIADSVIPWLRFIAVEEVPLVYQAADLLVFPYKAGTTSGALLTGLNYGKAVVATTLPFFREYLTHGETALLVEYGDVKAMVSALEELILNVQARTWMGEALGRQAAKGAGWEEIARKTTACYQATWEQ